LATNAQYSPARSFRSMARAAAYTSRVITCWLASCWAAGGFASRMFCSMSSPHWAAPTGRDRTAMSSGTAIAAMMIRHRLIPPFGARIRWASFMASDCLAGRHSRGTPHPCECAPHHALGRLFPHERRYPLARPRNLPLWKTRLPVSRMARF
jgi:hypothetical protein